MFVRLILLLTIVNESKIIILLISIPWPQWYFLKIFWRMEFPLVILLCWASEILLYPESLSLCCCVLIIGEQILKKIPTCKSTPTYFVYSTVTFDFSLNRNRNTYFNASFFAYVLGLSVTIFVMHMFKHAQPALLYLVPACLGIPTLIALINGDISAMFK